MGKSYDDILKTIIENAEVEEFFDLDELQELQDKFANSLGIASLITKSDGTPITRPSNFTGLCGKYVRQSQKGLKQCHSSDALIGCAGSGYLANKCLSAGLVDGGVSLFLGERHIGNWLFGQIRYSDDHMTDEQMKEKAMMLGIKAEDFKREYLKTPVMGRDCFAQIAGLALIIARKFSEEAWLKIVHRAEEEYKEEIEQSFQKKKEILEKENAIDFLTHLLVRNSFEQEIKKLEESQILPVAVVVADVNNLKLTNDIFGHKFGDQLLSEVARVMDQERFDGFILGRCGGDEFNVLIPGGNRSAAEWYCHRVTLELARNYNCCMMPSVAFGVGKKDKPDENIKDVSEIADYKMYRNKIRMKQNDDFLDSLKQVLFGRGLLDQEIIDQTKEMALDFVKYMEFNEYKKNLFLHMIELHNYGIVILSEEAYSQRFDYKPSLEIRRELSKVPVINCKLANLYSEYAGSAGLLQNFYENWDGFGVPNEIEADKIPELSRYGRVMCDYLYRSYQAPIGLGEEKKTALEHLWEYAGMIYSPDAVQVFTQFITHG